MKKILFFSLILSCMFSYGKCNKKKKCCNKKTTTAISSEKLNANEVWMQYNETKCANPWNFNWFVKPTQEQVLGAIKSDLIGKEIAVLEIRSSVDEDFVSCDACTCPNGTHIFVRVNKSETEELKALNFFETKDVPKKEVIDTTR